VRVYLNESERVRWEAFRNLFIRQLHPRDGLEAQQAQQIASIQWRLSRYEEAESVLLEREMEQQVQKYIADARKLEWDLTCDREYDEGFRKVKRGKMKEADAEAAFMASDKRDSLNRTRVDRRNEAIQLRETYQSTEDITPAEALAGALGSMPTMLDRIGRFQQRLETQLLRAWKQLRLLQDPEREIFEEEEIVGTNPADDETKPATEQVEPQQEPSADDASTEKPGGSRRRLRSEGTKVWNEAKSAASETESTTCTARSEQDVVNDINAVQKALDLMTNLDRSI
jgi:hypothetical protein